DLSGGRWSLDKRFTTAPFCWLEAGEKLPWNNSVATTAAGFFVQRVPCPYNGAEHCAAIINLPALLITLLCTGVLVFGIKESVTFNNVMVGVKMTTIGVFILFGLGHIDVANYSPLVPPNTGVRGEFGLSGLFDATISVFFAYIGFDAVTTAAQEARDPQKDLPIGIFASLGICTGLYILVCLVLTGMVNYRDIDIDAPVAAAVRRYGSPFVSILTEFGALAGLSSVLLTSLLAQPRIFQTMATDGLFPAVFAKLDPIRKTPVVATVTSGTICALLSSLLPVDFLGNLTSIGTLFAFFLVSVSVIVLRMTQPDLPRRFLIPGGPVWGGVVIPGMSAFFSLFLMAQAPLSSILRVVIWLAVGLLVYSFYGYRHSGLVGGKLYTELADVQSSSVFIEAADDVELEDL
ncbi:hypothetical protein HDU91_002762, partial [Kappamyces sp. JEL0680]